MACHSHLYLLLILELIGVGTPISTCTESRNLQQQVKLLKELINELHKYHHFDNIIIYGNFTSRNSFLTLKSLHIEEDLQHRLIYNGVCAMLAEHFFYSSHLLKPLMTFNTVSWKYANNTKAIPNLGNILTNKNLAIVALDDIFNMELNEFVALSLGACRETKILFLLIDHDQSDIKNFQLKRFFDWCWSKNMLNVILLFQKKYNTAGSSEDLKLEVYTYTPFPMPPKIIHLTEEHPREYFQDRTLNLLGYVFKTPVIADKPLVFKTTDPFSGAEIVTGISGKIYTEYVKHLNASFEELKGVDGNGSFTETMDHIYDLLTARKIDISIRPLTGLRPNKFSTSYPISNGNSCVVVPVKREMFLGLYIPRTLGLKMWILLVALFLTFLLAYMFINHDIYGVLRPWLAFSITLRGLLNMPVDNMGPHKTITMNSMSFKRKIFMHMLLLLTGMIYSQTQIAALSSFLSSTLYPEQIESLEDLVRANLSIMLVDYVFDVYHYLDLIPDNFSQNLIITDADTVSYHLNKLDTRYAYTVYNEEWKVIQHLQMGLSKPLFKIVPKLCVPNVYLTLPMQFNSPFHRSFNEYILYAQAVGLYIKWSDIIYWQILKANEIQVSVMETLKHLSPLKLEHLTYVLYIYIGGMIMASVAFLVELHLPGLRKRYTLQFESTK